MLILFLSYFSSSSAAAAAAVAAGPEGAILVTDSAHVL
jgi:hypothetical protein